MQPKSLLFYNFLTHLTLKMVSLKCNKIEKTLNREEFKRSEPTEMLFFLPVGFGILENNYLWSTGELAQLVQSTALTGQGSWVRVPYSPRFCKKPQIE